MLNVVCQNNPTILAYIKKNTLLILGKILSLDRHPDHGDISGLIYNLDSGERAGIVFDT